MYSITFAHLDDAFVQSGLQFRQDTIEQLRSKGLAQGSNSVSLKVLGFELTNLWSVAQCINHWGTTSITTTTITLMVHPL